MVHFYNYYGRKVQNGVYIKASAANELYNCIHSLLKRQLIHKLYFSLCKSWKYGNQQTASFWYLYNIRIWITNNKNIFWQSCKKYWHNRLWRHTLTFNFIFNFIFNLTFGAVCGRVSASHKKFWQKCINYTPNSDSPLTFNFA